MRSICSNSWYLVPCCPLKVTVDEVSVEPGAGEISVGGKALVVVVVPLVLVLPVEVEVVPLEEVELPPTFIV